MSIVPLQVPITRKERRMSRLKKLTAMSTLSLAVLVSACSPPQSEQKTAPVVSESKNTIDPDILQSVTKLVDSLYHGQYQVDEVFEDSSRLFGVVIRNQAGYKMLVWATPNGKHLIFGSVQDGIEGNRTMAIAQARGIAMPPGGNAKLSNSDGSYTLTPAQVTKLKQLPFSKQGTGPTTLWIIGDPLCPFCKRAHAAIDLQEVGSAVTANWILTSTVGGLQASQLAAEVIENRSTLEIAYATPRDEVPPTEVSAKPESLAAINEASRLLSEIHPNPGVPAVITERNGIYTMSTGFMPERYVAPEPTTNNEAEIPVARPGKASN